MDEINSLVYLYGFNLRQNDKLESLLEILNEHIKDKIKISLILIHDGVIGCSQKGEISSSLEKLLKYPISIYAMIPDIQARGIDSKNLRNGIKLINYEDLVDILIENRKIVSWI